MVAINAYLSCIDLSVLVGVWLRLVPLPILDCALCFRTVLYCSNGRYYSRPFLKEITHTLEYLNSSHSFYTHQATPFVLPLSHMLCSDQGCEAIVGGKLYHVI